MPNKPVRERILERIAERLELIKEGSSYFTNVTNVSRVRLSPTSAIDGNVTAIVFSAGERIVQASEGFGDSTGITEVTMLVTVRIWRLEEVISDTTSNQIVHDVKKCLLANRNLPDADNVSLIKNCRWIQTAAIGDESTAPYAALDVLFEVDYRESFADPAQLRI